MGIDSPVHHATRSRKDQGQVVVRLSISLSFACVDGARAIEDQVPRHAQLLGIPRRSHASRRAVTAVRAPGRT